MESMISAVLAYSFRPGWWRLGIGDRAAALAEVSDALAAAKRRGMTKAEMYESLRHDCNVIFWLMAGDADDVIAARSRIEESMGAYARARHGFLSVYESKTAERGAARKYFVAYLISKSPDWHLLSKERRAGIMAEHIAMAKGDPDNKGIESYTTASFGISDSEFVVLYELDSLPEWVRVTQRLRRAKARAWITKEAPILVGRAMHP